MPTVAPPGLAGFDTGSATGPPMGEMVGLRNEFDSEDGVGKRTATRRRFAPGNADLQKVERRQQRKDPISMRSSSTFLIRYSLGRAATAVHRNSSRHRCSLGSVSPIDGTAMSA